MSPSLKEASSWFYIPLTVIQAFINHSFHTCAFLKDLTFIRSSYFWLGDCIEENMPSFLLPPTRPNWYATLNGDDLVDVAIRNTNGKVDIVGFDAHLLPSHLQSAFFTKLFEWAKNANVTPLSCYGRWPGSPKHDTSVQLLYSFYEWERDRDISDSSASLE